MFFHCNDLSYQKRHKTPYLSVALTKGGIRQKMADLMELFRSLQKKDAAPAGPVEYIVACLGNPGSQYEGTRHNAGFLAADRIAEKRGFRIDRLKFKSLTGDCVIAGKRCLFLKPSTFMNLSGQAATEAMAFYKVPAERLIVIFDDISLPPGRLRIRQKGSDGGHNGIKNIICLTGKDSFPRIKIGVGQKPRPDYDLADWVLARPGKEDMELILEAAGRADAALEVMIGQSVAEAMNRFNG